MSPDTGADIPVDADVEQARRDGELEADAREHNERTGGGTIVDGERAAARKEHNDRTAFTGDPDDV